ncbi:MAG: DNA polymerase I [Verrucomicrobiota bacterium]
MAKRLFLLDGMALVYRAHFAFAVRPILTSKGLNTSAIYGFANTLLDILGKQQPTHLAVVFDTAAPTPRHVAYPEYKAQREAMPEDLSAALPHVRRLIEAFNIPVLSADGFEADDIIGTLARRAEKAGFKTFMVTPDKDFGQLVDENTFLFKPGRAGDDAEILDVEAIKKRWGIQRTEQVIDVLALMGDASDNIPGVPGIGEKTAIKLIGEFGSVENLLASTANLKGKLKESLEANREIALLSKQLVTILHDAPCPADLESLKLRPPNEESLKALLVEFEFNSLGKRLFGADFKAGRGFQSAQPDSAPTAETTAVVSPVVAEPDGLPVESKPAVPLKSLADVSHRFNVVNDAASRAKLIQELQTLDAVAFKAAVAGEDAKSARLEGLAFSWQPHAGVFVPLPSEPGRAATVLSEFKPLLESERLAKVGHNLKFDASVLRWRGLELRGTWFDTMVAHSLIEPDQRHALEYLSEACLGYSLIKAPEAKEEQLSLGDIASEKIAERVTEAAEVAWQLRGALEPLLKQRGQEKVFYEIESLLSPVLVAMEHEGIRVDSAALAEFASQLSAEMADAEKTIHQLAGREFNVASPRQLGEILFDVLKLSSTAKKTKTGQYATDEQTLMLLAPDHEIVRRLLDYRGAAKLKSTYAEALPAAIWPATGRIHTTYNQVATSTGRLNSQNPNLQNIPIRTERGQEIRKAFVPRDDQHRLLSADYSQIELRIIAGLSREAGLLEAFQSGADVHVATAAKVYGVPPAEVTSAMRGKAKMVNYGIAYGISAFGLAQRLNIPRKEGAEIIEAYFKQFSGIRQFMDETIQFAREHGYVQTVTGRRRYVRDINSSNATVRGAAERNAINAPIQGTAADMIKLAMIHIQQELVRRRLRTRMLLQVHDELVFDLYRDEEQEVLPLVEKKMRSAISLGVPIEVEMGIGATWLEAH